MKGVIMTTCEVEFKNELEWGYHYVEIPEDADVVFGARAISGPGGPDFLPDRLCWNVSPMRRDPLANWMGRQLREASWFRISEDEEKTISHSDDYAHRTMVYMIRGGYVYITAWEIIK
jgi:hypothetical protein